MIADLIERALEPIVDAMIGSSVPQVSKVGHLVCDTSAAVLSLLDDAEGKVPYVLISRKHRGAQLKTAFEAGRELGQREQLVPPPRGRPARVRHLRTV